MKITKKYAVLPSDFQINKYGLRCRLVNEDDAEFIVKLRTDPILSRYIHPTENNIEKQKEWIREYKKRELDGKDYYFIFSYNDSPIGVIRIYAIDVDKGCGTVGSWLCAHQTPMEQVLATILIGREILFEELNLRYDYFDVRKKNKKVQRMHDMFGAKIINEDELNFYYVLNKEDFEKNKIEILDLLNIQ